MTFPLGAITGSIAAMVVGRNNEYSNLSREYKEKITDDLVKAFSQIVLDNLSELEQDLVAHMDGMKEAVEDENNLVRIKTKIKRDVANELTKATREKILREMTEYYD